VFIDPVDMLSLQACTGSNKQQVFGMGQVYCFFIQPGNRVEGGAGNDDLPDL
jgi:hypothetical protein